MKINDIGPKPQSFNIERATKENADYLSIAWSGRYLQVTEVDRPGFDLGGSTGETSAGTGLGLGEDAAEEPLDQSLPGQRAKCPLRIPRW